MCTCMCMCVGREEFEILKKKNEKKLHWNEERVNNALKQNWSINHDGAWKSTQAWPLEQVYNANDVIYCRSLKDNVYGMSPYACVRVCECVCVGAVFHT